jgi:hypothetical protein
MAKIKLKINGKLFNLELEEEFANFLRNDLARNLGKDNNSIKELLSAYISKSNELFELTKKVKELNHKLS